jgi:signal transduction histidine kinase
LELKTPITGDEFRTLNLCLDDAIAEAVTAYAQEREQDSAEQGTERIGIFAHELRNLLNVSMLSFDAIKSGRVAVSGSTGLVLSRSLIGLRNLIELSLAEVRLDAGIGRLELLPVKSVVEEVELDAGALAEARGVSFRATPVDSTATVRGDRQVLAAAITNLLQNAFKFTPKDGQVTLRTLVSLDRVLFEVEDRCGGLPPGTAEELFEPFRQRGADRSGLGLGLSMCVKVAKANGGALRVRDLPGVGCVFTLDLPRDDSRVTPEAGRATA